MKKWALIFALVVLASAARAAVPFQPTVNPVVPVQNSPLQSSVVRGNFLATYNDEIALAGLIPPPSSGNGTVTNVSCSISTPGSPATCNVGTSTTTPTITIGLPEQGNGSLYQMSLGSTTSGHIAIYDGNGNVIDGGPPTSGVTWPSNGNIVISNGTNTPAGLAEVDGSCAVGSGGAWTAGSCGSGSGVTLSSTTSNVNYPLSMTSTISGNLSTLYNGSGFYVNPSAGVLNIPTGATYDINGTQIACSNLSNGATGCSTATGTSGATIMLNNGNNTVSGNDTYSGTSLYTGALAALSTGNGSLGATSTAGLLLEGKGSTNDITVENGSGTNTCTVARGATNWNCVGLQVGGTNVLTANQSITLSGDASGSGTTAITVTNTKVNGVAYGTSPSTNTVPVVTGSNTVTYEIVPVAAGGTGIASGTSGGIPAFTGSTTIASSGALTANLPIVGGGAGVAPSSGSRTGNTTLFATSTGSLTSGDLLKADANSNVVDAGVSQSNQAIRSITFIIDGGGSAISTGVKGTLSIPFACTINSVTLIADQSGSIVVDIWKKAFAGTLPTVANTITSSDLPTLSSAITSQDTTLTGWTTSVSANDMITYNVNSAATVTRVTVALKCTAS